MADEEEEGDDTESPIDRTGTRLLLLLLLVRMGRTCSTLRVLRSWADALPLASSSLRIRLRNLPDALKAIWPPETLGDEVALSELVLSRDVSLSALEFN